MVDHAGAGDEQRDGEEHHVAIRAGGEHHGLGDEAAEQWEASDGQGADDAERSGPGH